MAELESWNRPLFVAARCECGHAEYVLGDTATCPTCRNQRIFPHDCDLTLDEDETTTTTNHTTTAATKSNNPTSGVGTRTGTGHAAGANRKASER